VKRPSIGIARFSKIAFSVAKSSAMTIPGFPFEPLVKSDNINCISSGESFGGASVVGVMLNISLN